MEKEISIIINLFPVLTPGLGIMFESMQKENQAKRGETGPKMSREALEDAQKEFNKAYQEWLRAPKGSKSLTAPKLKDYLAGAAEKPAAEERAAGAPESGAVEVDLDAFREAFRKYNLNPSGKKPEPKDFPMKK